MLEMAFMFCCMFAHLSRRAPQIQLILPHQCFRWPISQCYQKWKVNCELSEPLQNVMGSSLVNATPFHQVSLEIVLMCWGSLSVILLTDKQTNATENITYLAGVIKPPNKYIFSSKTLMWGAQVKSHVDAGIRENNRKQKVTEHRSLRLPLMFTDGRSHVPIEQEALLGRWAQL